MADYKNNVKEFPSISGYDLGMGYTMNVSTVEDENLDIREYEIYNKNGDLVIEGSYEDNKDLTLKEVILNIESDFYDQQLSGYEDFNPAFEAFVDTWDIECVENQGEKYTGILIAVNETFNFEYDLKEDSLNIHGLSDSEISNLIDINMDYLTYEIGNMVKEMPSLEDKLVMADEITNAINPAPKLTAIGPAKKNEGLEM